MRVNEGLNRQAGGLIPTLGLNAGGAVGAVPDDALSHEILSFSLAQV